MNTVNEVGYASPQFAVLSETQLQDIHLAALEILRRTGMRYHHHEALELLAQAGAFVSDGNLVKFPAFMVEEAVASVPGRIVMCDRDGSRPYTWKEPGSTMAPAQTALISLILRLASSASSSRLI